MTHQLKVSKSELLKALGEYVFFDGYKLPDFITFNAESEEPRCHLNCNPCLDKGCSFCQTRIDGTIRGHKADQGACKCDCHTADFSGWKVPKDAIFVCCSCRADQSKVEVIEEIDQVKFLFNKEKVWYLEKINQLIRAVNRLSRG